MPDNAVSVVGNITRDPELKFVNSGAAVASFGLAVSRRWQNRESKEWEEQVSFIDVSCWRDLAENVAETLTKGMRVWVTGRLEQQNWQNDAGEKRSKIIVQADDVGPSLKWASAVVTRNPKKERGGQQGGQSAPPAQAPPQGRSEE